MLIADGLQKSTQPIPRTFVSKVSGPGRNPNMLAAQLVVKYVDEDNKALWRCVADGCNHSRRGNAQLDRILRHSTNCKYLRESNQSLWQEALMESRNGSLGAQLDKEITGETEKLDTQTNDPAPPLKKLKRQSTLDLGVFRASGRKEKEEHHKLFQAKVDHVIMRLICTRGLIPHILDSPEWKELMNLLNGIYHPTPSDMFTDKHIPREAVYIREKQIAILREIDNLTLTFDGNTTRKPQSIYTVHATTPSRVTYFLDGHEDSSEHHTQEWVTNKLAQVCRFHIHFFYFLTVNLDHPLRW